MGNLDARLDILAGRVLLFGAIVGLAVAVIGLGLSMLGVPAFRGPYGDLARLLTPGGGIDTLDLMEVGMLILMATPVAGIAVLAIGFLWLRRLRFAIVSVLLLILLIASSTFSVS